jgi:putative endonuclease
MSVIDRKGLVVKKEPCVYILTTAGNTVLYTGVTSNIIQRIQEHREGRKSAFTDRYRVKKLVYVDFFPSMEQAIDCEKRIKGGSRAKKLALIEAQNPEWVDLFPALRDQG